jgi:superfamily I DNA/RNA helicase
MACDDDILPLQERIEIVADESELDDIHDTERNLFYVACTRARDRLLVRRPTRVGVGVVGELRSWTMRMCGFHQRLLIYLFLFAEYGEAEDGWSRYRCEWA